MNSNSDDEVALVFDPVSGYSLSEPLVNIRFTLRKARECGVISGKEHDALLTAARSVFYPQRTYARIAAAAGTAGAGTQERFLAWVGENACDRKRLDAIEALEYIAGLEYLDRPAFVNYAMSCPDTRELPAICPATYKSDPDQAIITHDPVTRLSGI